MPQLVKTLYISETKNYIKDGRIYLLELLAKIYQFKTDMLITATARSLQLGT